VREQLFDAAEGHRDDRRRPAAVAARRTEPGVPGSSRTTSREGSACSRYVSVSFSVNVSALDFADLGSSPPARLRRVRQLRTRRTVHAEARLRIPAFGPTRRGRIQGPGQPSPARSRSSALSTSKRESLLTTDTSVRILMELEPGRRLPSGTEPRHTGKSADQTTKSPTGQGPHVKSPAPGTVRLRAHLDSPPSKTNQNYRPHIHRLLAESGQTG